ncbi:MAG: MFS transporter [Planctomycetota bacterium]
MAFDWIGYLRTRVGPMGLVRALRSRNYRLFFAGQGISLVGTWMQMVAVGWLVYRLTNSTMLLGLTGFAGQIPVLLLAPLGGVAADQWPLRRLLVITQTLSLVQALLLAGLTLSGIVSPAAIITLSAFLGIVNALDMPVRQAFVVEMLADPADLGNAIALNSLLVNGARLVGPALAGVLIAALGEGLCFLLNGISYIAVIAALLAMRVPARPARGAIRPIAAELAEGFRYALGFPPIRDVLGLLAVFSLMGMSYATIMPAFVRDVLHGDSRVYGLLLGTTGLGALVGATLLAARRSARGLGRTIAAGAMLFGGGLCIVAVFRTIALAAVLLPIVGLGMMLQIVASNTVLQILVDDDKRGRVMSLYAMAFLGMTPFGSLLVGGLAHSLGTPLALQIGGVCCLLGGLVFAGRLPALRPLARAIYLRKGLITQEDARAN